MFDTFEFNYAIEMWSIAFCVIGIVCSLMLVHANNDYRGQLITLFCLELFASAGDATTVLMRGRAGEFARTVLLTGNFVFYACTFLLQAGITSYICERVLESGGRPYHTWRRVVNMTAIVMCVLALCGMFYYFDANNLYHRTSLYWVSTAFVGIASTVNAVLVVVNRKELGSAALVCFLFYTIAPIVAAIIQTFYYGPNIAIVVTVLGLIAIFFEMQSHLAQTLITQTEELARSEAEATENRVAVMLSQIQPHFLFNTLDTIYGLVDEDTDAAKQSIASFSDYLRMNLDSLSRTSPIPIKTEMEHVQNYLELEKTSDPSRISYKLDITATDFAVPVLSVQTLVENAVKHGLGGREEGGTVHIETREEVGEYLVIVSDDGAGFDVSASVSDDGRTHVGLENTRSRLEAMCNGTLEVASEPGKGTQVVMRIPKEQA